MRSKFCISSTASFDQINKASTNKSITKQTFSFSRSNRFEAPKPKYRPHHEAAPKVPTEEITTKTVKELPSDTAKNQILQDAWQFHHPLVNTT